MGALKLSVIEEQLKQDAEEGKINSAELDYWLMSNMRIMETLSVEEPVC